MPPLRSPRFRGPLAGVLAVGVGAAGSFIGGYVAKHSPRVLTPKLPSVGRVNGI